MKSVLVNRPHIALLEVGKILRELKMTSYSLALRPAFEMLEFCPFFL